MGINWLQKKENLKEMETFTDYEKLEWIHCAIDEVLVTYPSLEVAYPLEIALELVENLREPYLREMGKYIPSK